MTAFEILNQFSYVIISLIVMSLTAAVMIWRQRRWQLTSTIVVSLGAVLALGFAVLRVGSGDINSVREAQNLLENGRPTLIEFYSNYCAGCMSVRPAVDSLAAEIQDTHDIIRVDIHTEFGRELRQAYGFAYTPEFHLFNANGSEVWRGHTLPGERLILESLADQQAKDT